MVDDGVAVYGGKRASHAGHGGTYIGTEEARIRKPASLLVDLRKRVAALKRKLIANMSSLVAALHQEEAMYDILRALFNAVRAARNGDDASLDSVVADLELLHLDEHQKLSWSRMLTNLGSDTIQGALLETTVTRAQSETSRLPVHPKLLSVMRDLAAISTKSARFVSTMLPDMPSTSTVQRSKHAAESLADKSCILKDNIEQLVMELKRLKKPLEGYGAHDELNIVSVSDLFQLLI